MIHLITMSLLLAGCSHNYKIDRQLNEVERIMTDAPIEALSILSDMDTFSMKEPQKAKRALLQAYIAVTWVVAVDMTQSDIQRILTDFDTDCTPFGIKSLIIKSEMAKKQGNPVARIEYLKDAEFLATQLDDKIDLAFIYLYLSQVYANGFNGIVSGYYANRSRLIFDELNHKKQSIDARMAYVNAIGINGDTKMFLDSLEAMREDVERYSTDSYKQFYNDQLARALSANGRSKEAIRIWEYIYPDNSATSNTLAHWAQSYISVNNPDSALIMIEKAISIPHNSADEYLCRNVQYGILQKLGRTNELAQIDSLRNKAANVDHRERQLEKSSLAINKKFESATQTAWSDLQAAKNRIRLIVSVSIILLATYAFSILYYRKQTRLLQMEHENDMLKIQCMQKDLFEKEHKHDELSKRITSLFKSRFDAIDKLATSYFEFKETPQEQKKIFSEAKNLIGDFGLPKSLQQLEDILNATRDDLMKLFDEDFPKISQAQRKLALFIFCGLSLQSISVFMGTDIRNIYVYKSRLKSTISRKECTRKELYLEYFA